MLKDDFGQDDSLKITRRSFFKILSGVFAGFITLSLSFPLIETLVGTISNKKNRSYSKVTSLNSIPEDEPFEPSFAMIVEDAFIKNTKTEEVWVIK